MSALFSRWVPLEERALLGAFAMAASSMGVIFGNLVTGGLLHFVRDWPITFYAWTLIGILWSTGFTLYVYSEPATHPRITPMEKALLLAKVGKYILCSVVKEKKQRNDQACNICHQSDKQIITEES